MKRIPHKLYVVFVKVPRSCGWTPIAYTHTWDDAQREAQFEGAFRIRVYKATGFELRFLYKTHKSRKAERKP